MTAREELTKMRADAWKGVASKISVIETMEGRSRELAVDALIKEVNRMKRLIDRFIDSKSDEELEIGKYRREN